MRLSPHVIWDMHVQKSQTWSAAGQPHFQKPQESIRRAHMHLSWTSDSKVRKNTHVLISIKQQHSLYGWNIITYITFFVILHQKWWFCVWVLFFVFFSNGVALAFCLLLQMPTSHCLRLAKKKEKGTDCMWKDNSFKKKKVMMQLWWNIFKTLQTELFNYLSHTFHTGKIPRSQIALWPLWRKLRGCCIPFSILECQIKESMEGVWLSFINSSEISERNNISVMLGF